MSHSDEREREKEKEREREDENKAFLEPRQARKSQSIIEMGDDESASRSKSGNGNEEEEKEEMKGSGVEMTEIGKGGDHKRDGWEKMGRPESSYERGKIPRSPGSRADSRDDDHANIYTQATASLDIKENDFLDSPEWLTRKQSTMQRYEVGFLAISDCMYLMWPRETLEELLEAYPSIETPLSGALGIDVSRKLFSSN